MQATEPGAAQTPDWVGEERNDTSRPSIVSLPTLAVIVVSVAILYVAKDVFLPLTLGMLFAFILAPVVNYLSRRGLHDSFAVALTVITAAALMALFVLIVAYQLSQIGANLPQYQGNVLAKIDGLMEAGKDNRLLSHLRFMLENISERLGALTATGDGAGSHALEVQVVQHSSVKDWITGVILPALSPIAMFGLIFVVVTFALLERDALRDKLVQLIGGSNILATSRLLAEAGSRVSTFLVGQVLVNVIYAVPICLGLWLIGVPNALFFGIVTLVARFLPYIGTFISAILPLLMAIAVSPDWSMALWTLALFALVELVTSNVIEPWFYGQRTGISPLAVIVSAMFWAWLWGPLGLFLATPLTVCVVVMGYNIPGLRLFAIILGDTPALGASARLYDRLLAGHPFSDMAAGISEAGGVPDYYNRTVIPALMLAQADHEAGLLSDRQIARISHAIGLMLEETEEEAEEEGEDADRPAAPLAIAGLAGAGERVAILNARTPLDALAARILAQMLRAEGAETVVLPNHAAMLSRLRQFQPTAVVIASLGGATRQTLALQIRQMRRMFPAARVLVAVWPGDGDAAKAPEGADYALVGAAAAAPPKAVAAAG